MAKKWIQSALKGSSKGSLTRWSKQHRLMNKSGTINLDKAHGFAERHGDTRRMRQVNLARNLKNLHKR